MTDRLSEIKELLEDNWFVDNPNGQDVNDEVQYLLDLVRSLEAEIEDWQKKAAKHLLNTQAATREIESLKSEYANVCKFTTQYEEERNAARAQAEALAEALEKCTTDLEYRGDYIDIAREALAAYKGSVK